MKNIKLLALIVLTLAVALMTLTSCEAVKDFAGNIFGDSADEHVHSFSEATCTAPKTCECGATEGEPLDHTYVDGKCACGAEDPDYVPHEHTFVEGECECGEKDPNYVPHEHSYESVVTAPTCTEDGYTTYTCECGDSYTGDKVDALGHTFINGECTCGAEYVAPETNWMLTTEIKNGDLVLIGAPAYGKLLSAEKVSADSFYNKGVDYDVDNFANVTDAEIFVVTVNDDGTYTFTSLTGDVIALADSYSSLNKDGNNKSWALSNRGDNTFLMKNTGRNLYLEWYNSKGNWSTYSAGNTNEYYLSFYVKGVTADEDHVHNHITSVTAPTCTEAGYTTYTCACGDTYKVDGEAATGHSHESSVTAPTCTEAGYTTYTCACGDTYKVDGEAATGHTFVDGICQCGEPDPDAHVHSYTPVVTAPTCTVAGYTTYTCACGDSYTGDETEIVPHVDENLDITCDFEGCTQRILPPADSKISLFTANHMIIVSLSNSYYVEGVITEITDAKNGIFIIEDEAGDSILVRLPKNADDVAYSSWTDVKVVVGDTVQIYGKPTRNTATSATEKAKVEGGVLTILKHEHNFSEATCDKDSVCACLAVGTPALGHIDENADNVCDRCPWKMNMAVSNIAIATDPNLANGVLSTDSTSWTWSDDNFDVVIAKGTSTFTLYTNAKAYMQLKKQNTFTVTSKKNLTMTSITISTTNATQLTNLKNAIGTAYEYTVDEANLTVTIALDSVTSFSFSNAGTTTAYVSGVSIAYEK